MTDVPTTEEFVVGLIVLGVFLRGLIALFFDLLGREKPEEMTAEQAKAILREPRQLEGEWFAYATKLVPCDPPPDEMPYNPPPRIIDGMQPKRR